ncbi:MAG TPA: peptide chain release factor N(5)-glutamine methyltransferase [Dehalococcoidia bacterium]|nr:peptide chain release factor N(5)-glutamine methyltransferase [Dehalococcoidia bacterium]
MKARKLAREIERLLRDADVDEAAFEAEYLVRTATDISRVKFFADPEVSVADEATARKFAGRRLGREPVAYIVGSREFFGLKFGVSRKVLVPRPESELLVDLALREAEQLPGATIIDVGTGCGAIAISIALNLDGTKTTVLGTDLSDEALQVAATNRSCHQASVGLIRTDLAASICAADVILANLPYVPSDEIDQLEPEVSKWEPRVALDGGKDGLGLVRRLVSDCRNRLRPRMLALEVGFGMARTVMSFAHEAGAQVDVVPDLGRIDRVVTARWQ